ncbi:Putative lipid kinase YtlR [Polaribacter huanghezhanensis]|uniref:diacylglycerol/lipid kinase family protein n=1 Tax=Polaribacter huanghezhanensis TaxID=1354726 RepID=UPI0026493167|nr:diacylglycerol kinase family protein [Polaribacter huanghezhanensis]WKD85501.1 Putative lipid kinase YtlR [Polaribacter huanghezhanensis]
MKTDWFLIMNPTSGNGKSKKIWREISDELKKQHISFSFAFTDYSKHEEELVETAIKNGFTKIISVGGDGTLHHVVNGIMKQKLVETNTIQLAVIPIGTGNDWVKTYNINAKIENSIAIISKEKTILQDIGKLETENNMITYFTNVAGIGYDGYVVNKLKNLKRFGGIAYLLSGLYGLLLYKPVDFTIKINEKKIQEKCLMVVFGICKFSGGGMQFTKDIDTSDGLLDVTIAKNLTLLDMIFNLPKLYNGKILYHKKVETYKTNSLKIIPISKSEKPFIQADGELINTGAVSVSIIETAIQFVIP